MRDEPNVGLRCFTARRKGMGLIYVAAILFCQALLLRYCVVD